MKGDGFGWGERFEAFGRALMGCVIFVGGKVRGLGCFE